MQLFKLKLVTIVTEEVLRDQLSQKILELGASGFTTHHASGYGSRGARRDAVSANMQFEIVCVDEVAEKILTYVSRQYYPNYACVAWLTDVQVVRGADYVKHSG